MQVDMCIVGWESTIGAWSRCENYCVLGEDVQCKVGTGGGVGGGRRVADTGRG